MSRYGSRTRVGQAVSDFGQPVTPSFGVEYLIVAGGAGGGTGFDGAGGGAGGLRSTVTNTGGGGALETTAKVFLNTNFGISVGAGGAGATGGIDTLTPGSNGSSSFFGANFAVGGGGGGGLAQ